MAGTGNSITLDRGQNNLTFTGGGNSIVYDLSTIGDTSTLAVTWHDTSAVDAALQKIDRSRRVALSVPHLLTVPVLVAASDSVTTVGKRVADICREAFDTLDVLPPPMQLAPWDLSQLWSRQRSGDAGLD